MREVSTQAVANSYSGEPESAPSQNQAQVVPPKKEVSAEEVSKRVKYVLAGPDTASTDQAQGLYLKSEISREGNPKPNLSAPKVSSSGNGGDGIGGHTEEELLGMSISQLMALARNLTIKAGDNKAKASSESVNTATTRIDQQNEANVAAIKSYVQKQAEQAEKENGPGSWILAIIGWIAAIAAAAVAIFASPFTGGASIALAVLAVGGAVAATVGLLSKISVAFGGDSFTLSSLVQKIMEKLLVAVGVSEEKAKIVAAFVGAPVALLAAPFDQKGIENILWASGKLAGQSDDEIQKWLGPTMMAIGIAVAVVMIGLSFAGGGGSIASQLTGLMEKLGPQLVGLIDKGVKLLKVALQAAQVGSDIERGILTKKVLDQRVIVEEGKAIMHLLEANQSMAQDSLQKALAYIQKSADSWGKMIEVSSEANEKIARNSRA